MNLYDLRVRTCGTGDRDEGRQRLEVEAFSYIIDKHNNLQFYLSSEYPDRKRTFANGYWCSVTEILE